MKTRPYRLGLCSISYLVLLLGMTMYWQYLNLNSFRNYVASANSYFGFRIPMYEMYLWTVVTSDVYVESLWSWLVMVWFEIPHDFVDYQSYMSSSLRIWSFWWLFLDLCSYNLDGSVTECTTSMEIFLAAPDGPPSWYGSNGSSCQSVWI
jgi:hypothetical protein